MNDILGGSQVLGLLSPELQAQAEQRARSAGLTNLGFALLQASQGQPGQRRPGLGQIIGQAGPVGLQAYQQSFDRTLQDMLRAQQFQDLQKQRAQQEKARQAQANLARAIMPTTPQTALEGAGRVGPTVDRAAQIGQTPQLTPQMAIQMAMNPDLPEPDRNMLFKYAEAMKPAEDKLPTDVQEYKFAVQQGFGGTFLDYQRDLRSAAATRITNNLPGGEKKLSETLGVSAGKMLESSYNEAVSAKDTLGVIRDIRPLITQEGIYAGPLSQAPRFVDQLATQFNVSGEDTKQKLANTAKVMQGLAKFELNAAAAMRGQGAITENERMLIQRAAAGRLDQFTVPEVNELLNALEKTSNYRLQQHDERLNTIKSSSRSPEVSGLVDLFKVTPLSTPLPSGATVRRIQ